MITVHENNTNLQQGIARCAKTAPYARIGLWGWFGIYLTGAVLLVFVFAHLWFIHFGTTEPLSASASARALQSAYVKGAELGLLLFAVVHALLGLKRIILDMEFLRERGARYLGWSLAIIGAIIITSGVVIINQLSSGGIG